VGFSSHSFLASVPIFPSYGHGVPADIIESNTRASWHKSDTAATFSPAPYKVRLSFRISQFLSLTAPPPETPKSDVCTAPLTPVTHTSELFTMTEGLLAVAAVVALSITVFVPVVATVLELLETVFELLETVFDDELIVLLMVEFVTVSVANATGAQNSPITIGAAQLNRA
jgi:hypothetical protein